MKTKIIPSMFFFYILFLIGFLYSCNKGLNLNKPSSKSENELFKEAKQMNGLGIFKIGKTTIPDILQLNKEIRKDQRYGYLLDDYWIGSKFELVEDYIESCPLTVMYNIDKYFIGDAEITDLNLFFYKDTLYKLSCNSSKNIKDAFTKKYGIGKRDSSYTESGIKNHKNYNNHYQIIWENDSIICNFNEDFKVNNDKVIANIHNVTINTKNTVLLKEILDCDNEEFHKKKYEEEKKRQNSLNNF